MGNLVWDRHQPNRQLAVRGSCGSQLFSMCVFGRQLVSRCLARNIANNLGSLSLFFFGYFMLYFLILSLKN